MESTMTHNETYDPVGFGGAFVRQFRFLWTSRRPLLLAVALLAMLVLSGEPWVQDQKMRLLLLWPVWLIFVPIAWSFAVFHSEGPSKRLYFWSHPTDRSQHIMARILAGLAWMWIMYGVLILTGWVFGLADGNAWQMAEIDLAGWANFFTGSLLMYLAICLLTVPSDYPIRWFFGLIFFFPLLISMLVEWLEMEETVETVLHPLIDEEWGLGVTIIGGLGRAVQELEHTLRAMQNPSYSGTVEFDLGTWWMATPAWTLLMVAIVVFIATRHPDTLPKWRGLRRRDS